MMTLCQTQEFHSLQEYNFPETIMTYLQEYQAVYFVLKAANSPRPARWVLEKSVDHGLSYKPWQVLVTTDLEMFF